jgi:predicted nuclease of restriction endonuclease-like (RecB) superfamily
MSDLIPNEHTNLLAEIKERIRTAQHAALRAVNKELITLYWDIGQMIKTRQRGETWGKSIVQQLGADLRNEFPGIGGLSASNLWRMKLFYEAYAGNEKLAPLVREIGWTHNLIILERCKDDLQREFYTRKTRKWVLIAWSQNCLLN